MTRKNIDFEKVRVEVECTSSDDSEYRCEVTTSIAVYGGMEIWRGISRLYYSAGGQLGSTEIAKLKYGGQTIVFHGKEINVGNLITKKRVASKSKNLM